jgi:hypothetical protein
VTVIFKNLWIEAARHTNTHHPQYRNRTHLPFAASYDGIDGFGTIAELTPKPSGLQSHS